MSDTEQQTKKKKNPGLIIIVLAFVVILAINLSGGSADVNWLESIDLAEKTAKDNGKPILVLFTTDKGEYKDNCHRMDYATINKPDIVKYINSSYNAVKYDYENNKDIAKKFGVKVLPSMVIKLYGKDDYRKLEGFINEKEFSSRTGNAFKELKE